MLTQVGDFVEGMVQGLLPYGAVIKLESGCVGLLHIGQISQERIKGMTIKEVFSRGDRVKVPGRVPLLLCWSVSGRGSFPPVFTTR